MEAAVGNFVATKVSASTQLRECLDFEVVIPIAEIAEALDTTPAEAEVAAAKAIATGLVVGSIDQLAATLHCTAGQPTKFEARHYDEIIARLELWKKNLVKLIA